MSGSEPVNTDRVAKGKGDSRDGSGDDPAEEFEDDPDSEAAADAQQVLNEIDEDTSSPKEDRTTTADIESESERGAITTTEGAVEYLEAFDESESEYDHWNGADFDTVTEGSLIEIWTGEMGFEEERAVVIEQIGEDEYTVVTENGVEKTLRSDIDTLDFDHTKEAPLSDVWHDRENHSNESTAHEMPTETAKNDSSWTETADFDQYRVDAEDGFTPGQSVELGDTIHQIESQSTEDGIDYYTTSEGTTLADVDGVITQVDDTSRVDRGEIQYVQWSDDADMDDGWYSVDDSIQEKDGTLVVEYVDESGTSHDVDGEAVEMDGLIKRKHRPTSVSPVQPSLSGSHKNYSGDYPTNPSLSSNVSLDQVSQSLTGSQQSSIERGLAKAQELGFTQGVTGVEELDVGGEAAGETLARFEPETGKIKINTDRMNQETLDSLSDNFSAGETVEDMVVHETVHAAHAQALKESDWTPKEMRENLLRADLSDSEAELMEREISSYAASNPLEAVAEVGTKITLGKEVSDDALHVYEKYGGPDL